MKKLFSMALALILSVSALTVSAAEVELFEGATEGDLKVGLDGVILTEGVDYTLEYEDNIQPGVAKITINFMGNYSGTQVATFNIKRKSSGGGHSSSSRPNNNTNIGSNNTTGNTSGNSNVTASDSNGNKVTVEKDVDKDKGTTLFVFPDIGSINDATCDITVTDDKGKVQPNQEVTLKDKNGNELVVVTDENGKIKIEDGEVITGTVKDENSSTGNNVTVSDSNGKPIDVEKSEDENTGTPTLVFPSVDTVADLSCEITLTDDSGKIKPNQEVTIKDKNGNEIIVITDDNGKIKIEDGKVIDGKIPVITPSGDRVVVSDSDGNSIGVPEIGSKEDGTPVLTIPNVDTIDKIDCDITITDDKGKIKPNQKVVIKDKDGNEIVVITDENGKIKIENGEVVIGKTDDEDSLPDSKVTVSDKDGNPVDLEKSEDKGKGTVTIKIPEGIDINDITYEIVITDEDGNPLPNKKVELEDTDGNVLIIITDDKGKIKITDGVVEIGTSKGTFVGGFKDVPIDAWFAQAVRNMVSKGLVKGYEDNTFRPANNITRAETVTLLSRILLPEVTNEVVKFTDIDASAWYAEAVNTIASAGYIKGYEDNTFRPDNYITRAEFLAILLRGNDVEKFVELPFSDVTGTEWSADYLYTAYNKGLISGYEDGTLRPDACITRAEAVTILDKYLIAESSSENLNENALTDKDILEVKAEY